MLMDLAEETDDWESQQAAAWTPEAVAATEGAQTFSSPESTITIYPTTISKAVPRAGTSKVAKALDVVMPKKIGATGAIKIWGLPPAVAYTLAAILLTGLGLYGYRAIAGGGRRVATNPRRRGKARGKKARRKRR
jgi:hypothetical protein